MKRFLRKWGIGLSVLLAVMLAGCQPAAGVNLDQMLLNQLDITSQEESGSFRLEIDWNEKYLEKEADSELAKLATLLGQVSVEIEEAKTDAAGRAIIEGSLALGGKSPIAFTLHMDKTKLYVAAEGVKRPVVIDLEELAGGSPAYSLDLQANQQMVLDMVKEAASYFVRHLPNPPTVDISREWTGVGGHYDTLTKVHAEINGEQFGELLVPYVDALIQDEEGFRTMLSGVLRFVSQIDPALLDNLGDGGEAGVPTDEELETLAEEGFRELFPLLKELRDRLSELKRSTEWELIFDKGIVLKTDLYLDDAMFIRKSDTELTIAPIALQLPTSPVHSITLSSHSERWNLNGNVTVPEVTVPDGALGPEELSGTTAVRMLQSIEEDSVLYDLLKNDLQIDDSRFEMNEYNFYGTAPILAGEGSAQALHVPVRYALDSFGNSIEYDHEAGEIRFVDEGTGQEIALRIGSSEARVDGAAVQLSVPVYLIDGNAYMAADDLFPLLKATYTYETDEWGSVTVTVERDL